MKCVHSSMSRLPLAKLTGGSSRHVATSEVSKKDPFEICRIKELHGHLIRTHQYRNAGAMSWVIRSYALSRASMREARMAFAELVNPSLPIWNHMIRGLSQTDSPIDALSIFDKMREQGLRCDNLTFIYVCKACSRIPDLLYGKKVHVCILKLGFESYLYVCNALIHTYGFCGELGFAKGVFNEMAERDLVSWNSLICAYSRCAKYKQVLALFDMMRAEKVSADAVTMVKVVLACVYLSESRLVDSMVEYIEDSGVEIDVFLGNTLIDMYGKRGMSVLAWNVFHRMVKRNVVSWNSMINVAAKSGDLISAKKMFDEMPERDVISWTSMITGYAQANQQEDAIWLFQEMMASNVKPDQITIATILSACAHLGRLDVGNAVHEYLTNNDIKPDCYIENALIDMYCKCGSVDRALKLFRNMKQTDVSWTSVICGVAINGDSNCALELFSEMLRKGIRPIHGTFVGILLACAHAGLVEKGLELFYRMQQDYGLQPEMKHYGCIVDLLCRGGDVDRAYEFIKNMSICPDVVVWRILLSACKLHGNLVIAKIALDKLLKLDPSNGVDYVLSSNSYASVERWDDATRMREMLDRGEIMRPFGWSSIQTISGVLCPSNSAH